MRLISAGTSLRWVAAISLALQLAWSQAALAQTRVSSWSIGGQGGEPWATNVLDWIALDDSVQVAGGIQPRQILPGENVLRERKGGLTQTNYFGYLWSKNRGRRGLALADLRLDWNPRIWNGGDAEASGSINLVDGDDFTPAYNYLRRTDNRPNTDTWITLDLAIPVPLDSIVFYPPLIGLTAEAPPRRYADIYPQAYEVTRQQEVVDWLLLEDETAAAGSPGYHALAETVGRTFANNRTVVSLKTGLVFTRFLRLKFGGVLTDMYLAEIQAFGRGYPAEARYVSQVRSFGVPVTFGAVTWHFTRYRQAPSGALAEDPSAPVYFRIRTRSGRDLDPQAYYIYDERGREVEVSSDYYFSPDVRRVADAFDEGRPGYRGPITDDTENWDGWSIDYPASGEQIRSADARQYFQFAFEITTEDPLAFGVLDSLAFQSSPLLADTAVAEVSLDGLPELRDHELAVRLGVDTVFVYDLRAVRGSAGQGYNGLDLQVPAGTRLLDLEINGQLADPGTDYALDDSDSELLGLTFLKPVADELRLRLRLRSALFHSSAFFAGNLVDRTEDAGVLPQSVLAGNARDDVASNQIQVVSQQVRLDILSPVEVVPPVLTPNGDQVNDEVAVQFTLFGVTDAPLRVKIYDVGGRLVADLSGNAASAGRFNPIWNGRDRAGALVPPGLYLVEVEVDVDRGTVRQITSLAVAY